MKKRTILLLEHLEDRNCPAPTFVWAPQPGSTVWENAGNWKQNGVVATDYPGDPAGKGVGTDFVDLDGATSVANCNLSTSLNIGALSMVGNYNGFLNISGNATLTLSEGFSFINTSGGQGPYISIDSGSTLNLVGEMDWDGGTIKGGQHGNGTFNVAEGGTLLVNPGANVACSLGVSLTNNGTTRLASSTGVLDGLNTFSDPPNTNGPFLLDNYGVLQVDPGGGNNFIMGGGTGVWTIHNAPVGEIEALSGDGIFSNYALYNEGVVSVGANRLEFWASTVLASRESYVQTGGATNLSDGGYLQARGGMIVAKGNVNYSGSLAGTGTATIDADLLMSGVNTLLAVGSIQNGQMGQVGWSGILNVNPRGNTTNGTAINCPEWYVWNDSNVINGKSYLYVNNTAQESVQFRGSISVTAIGVNPPIKGAVNWLVIECLNAFTDNGLAPPAGWGGQDINNSYKITY